MTTSQNLEQRQIRATLAVAYEARTANLIAFYDMHIDNSGTASTQAPMTPVEWEALAKQIKERLGL